MSDKILVSYVNLSVYILFVIVGSLLVSLLPIYVNPPTCEESSVKPLNELIVNSNQASPLLTRHKRGITAREAKLQAKLLRASPEHMSKYHPEMSLKKENLSSCPELDNPQPVKYPWNEKRLPKSIVPINYDLFLFLPLWGEGSVYSGEVTITVDVKESTNLILMHTSENEMLSLLNVTDKNGNKVEMDCMGVYLENDYLILRAKNNFTSQMGPYKVSISFTALLDKFESGLFEFKFSPSADASYRNETMLASRFEPLDARKAFPCFDEPEFKATFDIRIDHPVGTIALTNTKPLKDTPDEVSTWFTTQFARTPKMATALLGIVVFYEKDFDYVEANTTSNIPVRVYARKQYIDSNQADIALEMSVRIFNVLEDLFSDVENSLPEKIDLFAIPDYPNDAVSHFGLPIFAENKIIMANSSASDRNRMDAALLIAKQLSQFWFGNYVTFKWWDELWLQEAFGDYLKYYAVDTAFPEYSIKQQFISEELVNVLMEDGYPSSHPIYKELDDPYEIEQYFDNIERSKAAAILRMIAIEQGEADFIDALIIYLKANPWGSGDFNVFLNAIGNIGPWTAKDYFDRWIKQANYPVLFVDLTKQGNDYYLKVNQDRHLHAEFSLFNDEFIYISPWNYTWFVPLKCGFEYTDSQGYKDIYLEEFYVSSKSESFKLKIQSRNYNWVHCDREFSGYYVNSYTKENWAALGSALKSADVNLDEVDRASIIHHVFTDSYTDRSSYSNVVNVLSYLDSEDDYLPWRTVYHHLNNLLRVLDYDKAFLQISTYFINELAKFERDDLWENGDYPIENLFRETLIELSCRLQDSYCINKVAELWPSVRDNIDTSNITIPSHVRSIVYNYHFQNTYDIEAWFVFFRLYNTQVDLLERERYLNALTYTRLPWLLAHLSKSVDNIESYEIFDLFKHMSQKPVGREIAWDFLRFNYSDLINEYGEDDPRIGNLILDIAQSFENEFMFSELLEFVFYSENGASTFDKMKALEVAITNLVWLSDNEKDLIDSFGQIETPNILEDDLIERNTQALKLRLKQAYQNLKSKNSVKERKY